MVLTPKILFEDENLLVIDKPAGVTVNNAESVKNQETIQSWAEERLMEEIRKENDPIFTQRAGIVHRLDKETSGILLIAKNTKTFQDLQFQFKSHRIKKTYLVLVHGEVKPIEGEINAPIERLPWDREKFGVFPGGRESLTRYQVKETYKDEENKYSFVEVKPLTGRTHQIRVHFKYIGHPVVGDATYAGRKQSIADRKFCSRQFLHAESLEVRYPGINDKKTFLAQFPPDLQKVLQTLTKVT